MRRERDRTGGTVRRKIRLGELCEERDMIERTVATKMRLGELV